MKKLKIKIIIRLALLPLFIGVVILLPAGTFNFWHVYVYFGVLFIPMIFVIFYFLKKDPKFLERRMKIKEQQKQQKKIIFFSTFIYLLGFILPGFDYRFGWSNIPIIVVITADIIVFFSYIFIIYVFKVNSYASRVIEVDKDQTVISTGPYSIIRHPMYLGVIVMYLATPIALGSYWAIIPFALLPIFLVQRILNEEKILSEQLVGYKEYCKKVKFRIIPFIW
ncbi:MAG: S-isoprenylcysteine methyltransferase [Spirochaetes bacterium GWD1_27_9]|nr:MAG: S-isoprenylcysteine methyltransferase [Spirochaetes bacterium GWB1_27_13]OHD20945.1 MAG: S-isoprenylcysteine methyltransferase [Spirochaetes bacterium GWC1_27_15]OHD36568.1 MAG: S-isoprenylcysteine methyltransferase [Spirochaetes bacterium GWD1_27_9]